MRTRWIRTLVTPVVAMSLAACDGTTEPSPELVDMILDFCADETPSFLAAQNEGGTWTRVAGDANGTFTFQATPKVAIVIVHQVGSSSSSEFIYTSTTELQPFNNVACIETAGTKTLNGTVSGLPTGSSAMISMAGSFDYITSPVTSYSLTNLPGGSLDLVAQRESFVTSTVPDRVIIRRAQNLAATIPVLDFGSSEAADFTTNVATISGMMTSDDNYLTQDFHTSTTQDHSITSNAFFTSSTQTLYHVPSSMTQTGDLHELSVYAEGSGGTSYRGETQFYRAAGNRPVSLGAALNAPTITSATPSPYVRLRVQLQSQSEYGSVVSAFFDQSTSSANRIVVVTATSGYFGTTPAVWQFEIPDLSSVSGFPTSAMLQSGSTVDWWVDAYGGSAAGFFGRPSDGTTLDFAGRASAINTRQQYRASGGRVRLRSTMAMRQGLGVFR